VGAGRKEEEPHERSCGGGVSMEEEEGAESCRASIRLGFHRAAFSTHSGEKKMNGRDSL
jgi:hypothetical protein